MQLPAYGREFLTAALAGDTAEALLCVARKNAKSAIIAVLLLGYLVGPLRRAGFRAGVGSLDKTKAGELRRQMEEIAVASGLEGLTFRRTPYPGGVSSDSGTVEVLSADRGAGHASGFDLAIVDEIGLLHERDRAFVAGLRSSVSARGGRFVALSIHGDGPFVPEILDREGEPGLVVKHYAGDPDLALDDPANWALANPGLGSVKSRAYMASEARRALGTPADQPFFRAHELNLPGKPARELLVGLDDWRACVVDELPARRGVVTVGFDLGGASSMTSAVAYWPATGRLEALGAFPAVPSLGDRGRADGVGSLYERMHDREELEVYAGRVTPVARFLRAFAERLRGCKVVAAGADRHRSNEALQALDDAGVRWPMRWRGTGASAKADGSFDVRAFQRAVLTGRVSSEESLLMASAIGESELRYDDAGNPALRKGRERGRIDAASAAVIALGLAELTAARRPVRVRHAIVA